MSYIVINALPILAAAAAAFALGLGWYRLFDRSAADGMRQGAAARRMSVGETALIFLGEAWMAAILAGALILAPVEAGRWTVALGSAGIIWIGFVAPAIVVDHRRRQRPWRLTAIDAGHWLAAMLLMAAVLRAIGVER